MWVGCGPQVCGTVQAVLVDDFLEPQLDLVTTRRRELMRAVCLPCVEDRPLLLLDCEELDGICGGGVLVDPVVRLLPCRGLLPGRWGRELQVGKLRVTTDES